MESGWHKFIASMENITLLADTGDFFQLVGGSTPYRVLEIRIWQRGSTTLAMETIRIHRGTAGAGGAALTEYEYGKAGPVATVAALSLPTTDVGTDDFVYRMGWNLLQDTLNLPIPRLVIPCAANDDIGLAQESGVAHTGVGAQVVWEEYVGS